jgi:hypothetical protein
VVNEITLITGLKVDEANAKPFAVLVSRFLLTYYGMITCSEVTLAFRLNAMGDLPGTNGQGKDTDRVDFYGPNLTIDHIGSVLHRYMQKRANLAKKINDQRQTLSEEPPPSQEQIEMNDKLFANEYYRKYLNHEFSSVSLSYAYMVYDTLDKHGQIQLTNSKKKEYMDKAQKERDKEIAAPAISMQEKKSQNKMMEAYLNDIVPIEEVNLVKSYAKRLALLDLFKVWKEAGKLKIFEL